MAYSELIKNFEKIRSYMRDFYIYGFRTRTEFVRKSARSYDNERRRVESWLKGAVSFRQDASGKSVFISVDNRETLHNPFYKALKAKSFTNRDITLHFYILDVLSDGEKLPLRAIADRVSGRCEEAPGAAFYPDDATVRNKLKEYVSLGILAEEKLGREVLYSRNDMKWDMEGWRDAVAFASEAMPLGVIGSFILDKYKHVPELFSFKHHYLPGALDSEILAELLACRRERRNALITFSTRRSRGETHQALIYPLKLYISTQDGRENLLAYSFHVRRPRMYRLDKIRSVKMMDPQPKAEQLDMAGERFAEFLWGTSAGGDKRRTLHTLTMRIHAGKDEQYIADRLYREKRNGTVTRIDENTWEFSALVYDAQEMLPWIRTFTGRIERLTCTDAEVMRRFYGDLAAMYQIYGGDDDAVS
jgi:hypothetical protein